MPNIYKPSVRVPSGTLEFTLDCLPETVQVKIGKAYATARNAQVGVYAPNVAMPARVIPIQTMKLSNDEGADSVVLTFPRVELNSTLQVANGLGANATYVYKIVFDRIPFIDVQSISIKSKFTTYPRCVRDNYKGKDLLQIIGNTSSKLMYFKLMQDVLSEYVFAFNSSVATFCLGGMVVALIWFTILLLTYGRYLYFCSDRSLTTEVVKVLEQSPTVLKSFGQVKVLGVHFQLQDRNLSFAKTMGPAFGFLLTVSSLSAALHPSVQASQDTFLLISGIHLALVATFVGLAIRIMAQFAQRVHRDLAERVFLLLQEKVQSETKESQHAAKV